MFKSLCISICILAAGTLGAAGWDPLPPEVWAVAENPAKGIRDAVILEARIGFQRGFSE